MYYSTKTYSKEMGVIYTNFIKALLYNRLNLNLGRFKKREEIIEYLEKFQGDKLFTRQQISKFKAQGEFERVPLTPQSKQFINYVKREFPEFDEFEFTLVAPIIKEIVTKPESIVETKVVETKIVSKVQPVITDEIESVVQSNKEVVVQPTITIIEPVVKVEPSIEPAIKIEPPVIIQSKDIIVETAIVEPAIVNGASADPNPLVMDKASEETITNIAENITKAAPTVIMQSQETVVETITKVVEPVIERVIEPVIDIITKPVVSLEAQPTIVINNANNVQAINNAEATTITSTKEASSNLDTILSIFGLRTIWNFIKEIFGLDGYGIIFLLIQLPYLVMFLLMFKDNPEVAKYLFDNFGIEEFKAPSTIPNTELAPIDFDFYFVDPLGFNDDEFITIASEENMNQEDAARYYADDSNVEYFDYFDYYHSNKDDNLSNTEGIDFKDIATDISNSLLDTTKQATESIKDKINTLNDKPLESEVHIIDDQFSGLIDVYPKDNTLINKPKEMLTKATTFATGGKSTWWFPMLDFNNLNYFPSLFDIFNTSNTINKPMVEPITSKADYSKTLINQLYKVLELNNIDISKVENKYKSIGYNLNAKDLIDIETKGKEIQLRPRINTNVDIKTLDALEGVTPRVEINTSKNSSLITDNTTFSTYFHWGNPIPMIEDSPREPLNTPLITISEDKPKDENLFSNLASKVQSIFFDTQIPSVNTSHIRPLSFSEEDLYDTKTSIDNLFKTNQSIIELDKQISIFNERHIDNQHKQNELIKEITQFSKEKDDLKIKINTGNNSRWDYNKLSTINSKLTYLKNQLAELKKFDDSELSNLLDKKSALVELKNKLEKELGNIAKTPV